MQGRDQRQQTVLGCLVRRRGADGVMCAVVQAQCENMARKWHVYMTMDGRISMAGLSNSRARYLAEAIKDSVQNC